MTRQQSINDFILKIARKDMTTAETILAIGVFYDRAYARGVIEGATHAVTANKLVQRTYETGTLKLRPKVSP